MQNLINQLFPSLQKHRKISIGPRREPLQVDHSPTAFSLSGLVDSLLCIRSPVIRPLLRCSVRLFF